MTPHPSIKHTTYKAFRGFTAQLYLFSCLGNLKFVEETTAGPSTPFAAKKRQTTLRMTIVCSTSNKNRRQPGQHFIHDCGRYAFQKASFAGGEVNASQLIAANYANGLYAHARQRNGKTSVACEGAACRDGDNNRRLRCRVESIRGYDQYWPRPSLLMPCRGIERNQPNLSAFHSNSRPTGAESSHSRSSFVMGDFRLLCASNSLRV